MKLSDLERNEDVLERQLEDPEFRAHWQATALARLVARQLVEFRAEHGLSQTELASELGLTQARVSQLERGDTELKLSTLYRLVDPLGMQVALDIRPAPRRRARRPAHTHRKRTPKLTERLTVGGTTTTVEVATG